MNEALEETLAVAAPSTVIGIGIAADAPVAEALAHAGARLDTLPWGTRGSLQTLKALRARGRYDLGIVLADRAAPGIIRQTPIVARVRDVHARVTWVLADLGARRTARGRRWTADGLRALGFTAMPAVSTVAGLTLFVHDVGTYKPTPDWLNPNGWANPEMWNRFRW